MDSINASNDTPIDTCNHSSWHFTRKLSRSTTRTNENPSVATAAAAHIHTPHCRHCRRRCKLMKVRLLCALATNRILFLFVNKQIHEIVGWERGMRWYRATQCQCNNLNTLTYIYISFVIHFDWNARAGTLEHHWNIRIEHCTSQPSSNWVNEFIGSGTDLNGLIVFLFSRSMLNILPRTCQLWHFDCLHRNKYGRHWSLALMWE